ncbi:hypothetical protein [Thermoflexus sp.]|uniref:hypothetical protein n=1 Tax=Thermoflexus sp. TaxID=1969742 RepID=UPI0035E3FB2D
MKRIAYATIFLKPEGQTLSPLEIEQNREWVKHLIQRMGLEQKQVHEAPMGFDLEVDVNSPAFSLLLEAIRARPDLAPRYISIWRYYTPSELEAAPLLIWRLTNQAIEDDYYDLHKDGYQGGPQASHRRCPACRAELEQVRDLMVNARKMGKRDLSLTYSFEIILSPRLAHWLQEAKFTGFTLRPVWHYTRPHEGEPPLYQLVVTHTLPPMASPPTQFEEVKHCAECGTTTRYLKHTHYWGEIRYYEETDVYYTPEVLENAQDFNRTAELFGDLPNGHPLVLISQRVYRFLREHKVKGWEVVPVYEVRKGE